MVNIVQEEEDVWQQLPHGHPWDIVCPLWNSAWLSEKGRKRVLLIHLQSHSDFPLLNILRYFLKINVGANYCPLCTNVKDIGTQDQELSSTLAFQAACGQLKVMLPTCPGPRWRLHPGGSAVRGRGYSWKLLVLVSQEPQRSVYRVWMEGGSPSGNLKLKETTHDPRTGRQVWDVADSPWKTLLRYPNDKWLMSRL